MSSFPGGETLADDVILVDQSHVTRAVDAVEVAKSVSGFARGSRRVVAVAGALDFSGDSDYDNLSAFGALMVPTQHHPGFCRGAGSESALSVGRNGRKLGRRVALL